MKYVPVSVGIVLCVIFAVAVIASVSRDEKTGIHLIPLKDIWAHNMPGTREVTELEAGNAAGLLFEQIGGALKFIPKGQTVAKGFAVAGTDKEALRNAHAVLVNSKKLQQSFPAVNDFWLVFFSHSFGQYVHLDNVERSGTKIRVSYRFVPHETKQMSAHFAMIPLGKLSPGKYRVDIVRLPLEQKYVAQGFKAIDRQWEARVVCQPFSFTVK
jgi:hypothetical protein